MFCPKCSQHQVSEEARYCSRCGFTLATVREAVEKEGATGGRSAGEVKRAAVIGFIAVTLSAIFFLVTLVNGIPEPSYVVQLNMLVAILVHLSALGYVTYKFLPMRKRPVADDRPPEIEGAATTKNLLDKADFSDLVEIPRSNKNEVIESSITESTTSLLSKHKS